MINHIYRALRRLTFPIGFLFGEAVCVVILLSSFIVWVVSGKETLGWLLNFIEGPGTAYWNWVKS